MEKLSKTLRRAAVLGSWVNRFCRQALREIEDAYKEMLSEMLDYAVDHGASQSTLDLLQQV